MFKDVQQLKLKEALDTYEQLKLKKEAMLDDVRALQNKLWDMEFRMQCGVNDYRGKKKFSVWERLISKRKAYREYQSFLAELKTLPEKMAILSSEIEIAEMQATDAIEKSGILQDLKDIEELSYEIERATTLGNLKITPAEAVKLLEDNEIVPVLDESDCVVFDRPREYENKGKAALCAVHKMDIMPTKSRLTTLREAGVKQTEKVTLDGKEYEYSFLLERNTIHVSLNDEVSSHMYGNWENCHYTVLQPFVEIPNENIGAMVPNDTYTRGGIDLTENAWILCPENEVETVKQLNPHVHVLGYKGENSKGLAAPFLSQLGYRAEHVGQWGWADFESQQQIFGLAERENLSIVQHSYSTDFEDEEFNIFTNKAIAIIKMLIDKGLVQSVADFERLKSQLIKSQYDFPVSSIISHTKVNDLKLIDDTAIVANRRNVQIFAEKMQHAGMPLNQDEQLALQVQLEDSSSAVACEMRGNSNVSDFVTHIMLNSAIRSRTMQTENVM